MVIHPFNYKRPGEWFVPRRKKKPALPSFPEEPAAEISFPHDLVGEDGKPDELLPFYEDARSEAMAQLEAVLFLSREPLSSRRLAQLAELPEGTKTRGLLRDLNLRYDRRQCAFRIVEVAGGFQLRTRPEFAPWLVRMQEVPTTVRLSAPALETLSVIAYKQPVLRAEVERLRGVQCGELIRQLLDQDLVRIVGRSEELGRPFFYGTTKYFLQVFGLGSLQELPDREELSPEEAENAEPAL